MKLLVVMCLTLAVVGAGHAAFGGKPPLGPNDSLRKLFAPYDLVKLSCLGANYNENLLDMRVNVPSYTHLGFDSNSSDAWHLHFPDDLGRFTEALVWEDQLSPVVRLELVRRMVKGILAAHVPGTQGYSNFRHRSAGKVFMIFDEEAASGAGRVTLSNWGDSIEGKVKVGFRAEVGGKWLEMERFSRLDDPDRAGDPSVARSPRYWNESPFVFHRLYRSPECGVDFTGRYWLSDEDKPVEFSYSSRDARRLQIVIGEPGRPMPLFLDAGAPGTIHLPDRKTTYSSGTDGSVTLSKPDFSYFVLTKQTAWASPGYSIALLVMWEGRPEEIEALAENGYGEIRLTCANKGKVWLCPFQWVNDSDMEYVYRGAERFLANGTLLNNGYPQMDLQNAIPAGLAAGAYLLAKYDDPFARTAAINAEIMADALLDPEPQGKVLLRSFFPARTAAWMLRLGKVLSDQRLIEKYTPLVERTMKRMMSAEVGYDGKGWASGWDHFNSAKTIRLAYEATGNKDYLDAFDRAMTVYTIDEQGIYRYGEKMQAPGGFDTYFGSHPLGLWGLAGKLDWCEKLINLDVPAGWQAGDQSAKDLWNDTGVGPWAQDDANPEYVGICLRAANIPVGEKHVLPVGAFPLFDAKGAIQVTDQPIVENPYFRPGAGKPIVLPPGRTKMPHNVVTATLAPGSAEERRHTVARARDSVTYAFDAKDAVGAAIDTRLKGSGYIIEASPDGRRWFTRLDTWSPDPRWQSVDLSFLTGSTDELVKLVVTAPPEDSTLLVDVGRSRVEREHCRYIPEGGHVVYRLSVPGAVECRLEIILGNGCRIECSPDGTTWHAKRDTSLSGSAPLPDSGWLHFVDATDCLGSDGSLFVRLSSPPDASAFGDREAFVRRLTAYGVLSSPRVFVRISSTRPAGEFELGEMVFRKWSDSRRIDSP